MKPVSRFASPAWRRRTTALLAGTLWMFAVPCWAASENLILEAEVEPKKVYVQAQARYTVRFYQAVDVRDLELHDPVLPLAELRRAGEDRVDDTTRNGRRYRLIERSYVLSPFASGKLTLGGAHATGTIASVGGASPGARESVRLDVPPLELQVLPIPSAAEEGPWLPARALTVTESWGAQPQEVRVGEPLYRIIRIEALGLDAAQLPALELSGPGFQAYPETPRFENRLKDGFNIGLREQGFRLVPIQSGELVLPAVQVRWWDVTTDRVRAAVLPETRVQIAPGIADPAFPVSGPAPVASVAQTSDDPSSPVSPPASDRTRLFAAALAASMLLAGMAWFSYRVTRGLSRSPLRALRRACRRSDARAASEALLRWGAQRWPADPPHSLEALAARLLDQEASAALLRLDRHIYGPPGAPWHPAALRRFPGKGKRSVSRTTDRFPPLYSD